MSDETVTLRPGGRGDNGDDGPGREGYGGVRCGPVPSDWGPAEFGPQAGSYRTGSLRIRVEVVVPLVLVAPATPTLE